MLCRPAAAARLLAAVPTAASWAKRGFIDALGDALLLHFEARAPRVCHAGGGGRRGGTHIAAAAVREFCRLGRAHDFVTAACRGGAVMLPAGELRRIFDTARARDPHLARVAEEPAWLVAAHLRWVLPGSRVSSRAPHLSPTDAHGIAWAAMGGAGGARAVNYMAQWYRTHGRITDDDARGAEDALLHVALREAAEGVSRGAGVVATASEPPPTTDHEAICFLLDAAARLRTVGAVAALSPAVEAAVCGAMPEDTTRLQTRPAHPRAPVSTGLALPAVATLASSASAPDADVAVLLTHLLTAYYTCRVESPVFLEYVHRSRFWGGGGDEGWDGGGGSAGDALPPLMRLPPHAALGALRASVGYGYAGTVLAWALFAAMPPAERLTLKETARFALVLAVWVREGGDVADALKAAMDCVARRLRRGLDQLGGASRGVGQTPTPTPTPSARSHSGDPDPDRSGRPPRLPLHGHDVLYLLHAAFLVEATLPTTPAAAFQLERLVMHPAFRAEGRDWGELLVGFARLRSGSAGLYRHLFDHALVTMIPEDEEAGSRWTGTARNAGKGGDRGDGAAGEVPVGTSSPTLLHPPGMNGATRSDRVSEADDGGDGGGRQEGGDNSSCSSGRSTAALTEWLQAGAPPRAVRAGGAVDGDEREGGYDCREDEAGAPAIAGATAALIAHADVPLLHAMLRAMHKAGVDATGRRCVLLVEVLWGVFGSDPLRVDPARLPSLLALTRETTPPEGSPWRWYQVVVDTLGVSADYQSTFSCTDAKRLLAALSELRIPAPRDLVSLKLSAASATVAREGPPSAGIDDGRLARQLLARETKAPPRYSRSVVGHPLIRDAVAQRALVEW